MSWEVKPLEEVCNVEFGTRVVKKKDGGSIYPVYGGGGATFSMDEFNRVDRLVVARFAMSEQCTRFVQGKFFLNDSGLTVSPRDSKKLALDFLNYQLLALNDEIYALGKGTAQRNLESDAFRRLQLSIPNSLPEQQRIVGKLDAAFTALTEAQAHVERNRANARELFESYLRQSFEARGDKWEMKLLQDVALEFGRGKSKHRPRGDVRLLGGKYPFIQTGDISNARQYIRCYTQTYSEMGLAQSKLWPRGTICMAIVGVNVADTAILDFDACFPDSVIGIVVDDKKAFNEYVQYLLEFFKAELKEKGKGTARDNMNLGMFQAHKFPFPSRVKQQQIVEQLNTLRTEAMELETTYQQKLTQLLGLKKAVLGAAFRGEL